MARGLIVAAASSGAGKTSLTLGLIAAFQAAGQRVRPFKVGPDYIDPTYLSAAAGGAACANLDPWAMRPETLARLVASVGPKDLAVVEGVMGLHDGPGSTADLARATGWPLILVVDAAGSAQTAAAVAEGLALRDPDLGIVAAVFNRVASPRHERMIRQGLRSFLPCWCLPRAPDLTLPRRHLGLHLAEEQADLPAFLARAARWAEPLLPLADFANEARTTRSTRLHGPVQSTSDLVGALGARRADLGLTFAYPHLNVPRGTIFLPGGYPEAYLEAIASDPTFLPDLRAAAAAGVPIYGECGGFMVLGDAIVDAEGKRHDMAGLLPLVTTFAKRTRHLGYREVGVLADFAWGASGQRWRGHEFHYSQIAWQGVGQALFRSRDAHGADLGPQGLKVGSVAGSYLHLIDQRA